MRPLASDSSTLSRGPSATTRPRSKTIRRSTSDKSDERCVIRTKVFSPITSGSCFLMTSSLRVSIELVGSSMIKMLGRRSSARATAIDWRWPPDRPSPRSPTGRS